MGKNSETDEMCYRAVCVHGRAIVLVSDEPDTRDQIAGEIGDWIRSGLFVERVTNEEARTGRKFGCSPCRNASRLTDNDGL